MAGRTSLLQGYADELTVSHAKRVVLELSAGSIIEAEAAAALVASVLREHEKAPEKVHAGHERAEAENKGTRSVATTKLESGAERGQREAGGHTMIEPRREAERDGVNMAGVEVAAGGGEGAGGKAKGSDVCFTCAKCGELFGHGGERDEEEDACCMVRRHCAAHSEASLRCTLWPYVSS